MVPCTLLLQGVQLMDEINYYSITIWILNLVSLDAGVFFHTQWHFENPAAISSGTAVDRGSDGDEGHTCAGVRETATLS